LSDPLDSQLPDSMPRLRAHLARRVGRGSGIEAEDVAQEVAARALRYRSGFDGERALWPWLRRLAERVLSDQHASRRRRAEREVALDLEGASEPEAGPTAVCPLEARDEVERLLARLGPIEREVLLRFHQLEQSVRAIASELALPEGTVKSHLSRARRRLADAPNPSGASDDAG